MKTLTGRRRAQLALVVGAVITLAACGSSGGKASVNAGAPPSTSTPTPDRAGVVVKAASVPKVGAVLVDANGMTLYTLKKGSNPVACTGQCASAWPPLILASGTTAAVGAPGVAGLGTKSEAAGTQVTEAGAPLYRFSDDQASGDAHGDGISSFGGVWHVVAAPNGAVAASPATEAPAPAPTTTPTTMYSYGGGY